MFYRRMTAAALFRAMLKLVLLAVLLGQPALARSVPPAPVAAVPRPGLWRMDVPPPERMPVIDPQAATATGVLPHGLSPWGMFLTADIIVQAVMVGLAFASLVTWAIWFAKALQLAAARRRAAAAAAILTEAPSLAEAGGRLNGRRGAGPALLRVAEQELAATADVPTGKIQERVASRLE
ncbi:MAG: tonB-system energizer ExbB, partial [Geminicoccaceae bacterium]